MFFAGGSFTYPDLIHSPPRRYRELYRTESQEQARISDYTIAQEPHRGTDNFGWRVTSTIEGRDTVSDITVLTWSDLVKSSMDRGGIVDLSVAY
jgi:hypothetical protein